MDYLRRVDGKNADWTEMSIELDEKHVDRLRDILDDHTKNSLGHLCGVVRYLRDELDINVGEKQ
jgi:hypothetical protein